MNKFVYKGGESGESRLMKVGEGDYEEGIRKYTGIIQ